MSLMDSSQQKIVQECLVELKEAGITADPPQRSIQNYMLPYLTGVLRETLRTRAPAGGGFRVSSAPLTIGQYEIPAGTVITPDPRINDMDEKLFPNPKLFEPLRCAYVYMYVRVYVCTYIYIYMVCVYAYMGILL